MGIGEGPYTGVGVRQLLNCGAGLDTGEQEMWFVSTTTAGVGDRLHQIEQALSDGGILPHPRLVHLAPGLREIVLEGADALVGVAAEELPDLREELTALSRAGLLMRKPGDELRLYMAVQPVLVHEARGQADDAHEPFPQELHAQVGVARRPPALERGELRTAVGRLGEDDSRVPELSVHVADEGVELTPAGGDELLILVLVRREGVHARGRTLAQGVEDDEEEFAAVVLTHAEPDGLSVGSRGGLGSLGENREDEWEGDVGGIECP